MSEDDPEYTNKKDDSFAEKYRLWLVIPLAVSGIVATSNLKAGGGLLLFFGFVWLLGLAIEAILKVAGKLLPKRLSPDQKEEIRFASSATLFLGGCAIIGIVLRGENVLSTWLDEVMPDGVTLWFIDPVFALVALIAIWIHAAYKVSR